MATTSCLRMVQFSPPPPLLISKSEREKNFFLIHSDYALIILLLWVFVQASQLETQETTIALSESYN